MILSEGEKKKELSEYPCIYKYQASDQLIAEVMNYYAVEAVPAPMAMLKKEGGDRWYLFSGRPVHENLSGADLRTASGTGTQGFVSESGGISRF